MIEQPTSFLDTLIRGSRKLELDYEQASHGASESAARVRAAVAKFLDGYAAFNQISPEAAAASYMATVRSYANDIKCSCKPANTRCKSTRRNQCSRGSTTTCFSFSRSS